MTSATDAAWSVLSTYDERVEALEAEREAADNAILDAPVQTLTDARRKLETAAQHAHRDYVDDWAWRLVRSALEGLRELDEPDEEPDAA